MPILVLLLLRVTQPTWRSQSIHMTCCSSVLDLLSAGKGQFGKFAFQLAIISYWNKNGSYDGEVDVWMALQLGKV